MAYMKNKRFKWVVEIEIDELWVADGYEATAERIQEAILCRSLGWAQDHEVKVKQVSSPKKADIAKAQGEL